MRGPMRRFSMAGAEHGDFLMKSCTWLAFLGAAIPIRVSPGAGSVASMFIAAGGLIVSVARPA